MSNSALEPSQHAFVISHADDIALAEGNGELSQLTLGHRQIGLALRVLELETSLLAVGDDIAHR